MGFKLGHVPWNKGIAHSKKTKHRMGVAHTGMSHSEETKRKISEAKQGKKGNPAWNKGKPKEQQPFYGKQHSEKTKQKISEANKGELNPRGMSGKHHTEKAKQKMRLKHLDRIEQKYGHIFPGYNPEACKLIDEYGKQHGYNFQHALNGGEFHIKELGYWVDGYDEEKNVVIEVDESHHKYLRKKDAQRQHEIEDYLACKFVRVWL